MLVTQPWNQGWETDNRNSIRVKDANEMSVIIEIASSRVKEAVKSESLKRTEDAIKRLSKKTN